MPEAQTEQDSAGTLLTPAAAEPEANAVPMQPDTSGGQPEPNGEAPIPSTPGETPPTKVDPRPRDDLGRFSPKEGDEPLPDPVKEAVARLARPDPAKAEPAKPAAAKVEQPGKVAPPEKAKAPPAKDPSQPAPVDDLDAPQAEKAQWKPHTREKFDKVLTTLRSERESRKADEPFLAHGREFQAMLDEHRIADDMPFVPRDHLAGLVVSQAAINRGLLAIDQGRSPAKADAEVLSRLGQSVDLLREQFGVQSTRQTPAAPAPFTGELPDDLKDLVEVYGIPEDRVRMLAALEQVASPPAPAQPPAAPALAPQAQAPAAKPEGVDWDAVYSRKLVSELAGEGESNASNAMLSLISNPAVKTEVIKAFPGTRPADVPALFNALDAKTRYGLLKDARRAMAKAAVPAPSPLPPPTTQRSVPNPQAPRRAAASSDPVADAISYLSR